MKTKLGNFFMGMGAVLMVAALALFLYNQQEQARAEESVNALMPQIVEAIYARQEDAAATAEGVPVVMEPQTEEMAAVLIDGYDYIGFVGIPALNLELPVMADWSDSKLKIAPCRFSGSVYSDDLVIMAHNYKRHFGPLSKLRVEDTVTVTDMDGVTVEYEVVALDVLEPTAVEEMTAGDYDLTLFTCTYGGESRVTVRCERVEAGSALG